MKCPHCSTIFVVAMSYSTTWPTGDSEEYETGYRLAYTHCPECNELVVLLQRGEFCLIFRDERVAEETLRLIDTEEVLYPKILYRQVEHEVPERYKKDYREASAVLPYSSKASAALSRRILQQILREEFNITGPNLAQEIEIFIDRKDIPSYLSEAIDAIRNVGNFAAHPQKDIHTGEIIDVEPGEAEWLLDVLDALFDFTFVQPKRLETRRQALNQKLRSLGKPQMKSKKSNPKNTT